MSLVRKIGTVVVAGGLLLSAGYSLAQQATPDTGNNELGTARPDQPAPVQEPEGTMTLDIMGQIIARLDKDAKQPQPGYWQFTIEKTPVVVITDKKANRMRIIVPIARLAQLTKDDLLRIAQANFDSALDSRYAIAREILWSAFVHPLQELHNRQFITAVGQTVNLALTYGSTYTSGGLTFGGGDSGDILRRQLIDELLKKGQDI